MFKSGSNRFGLVLGCLVGCVAAAGSPLAAAHNVLPAVQDTTASPVAAAEVRGWLARMQDAALRKSFQGTFIVTSGGAASSARIAHFQVGDNQFERIESLDGQARHVYRHNDLIQTVWPDSRTAVIEQRSRLGTFPALIQGGLDKLADLYEVRPLGTSRVAGHEAQAMLMSPRDNLRFSYRLWSDKDSGLLLRADVLNERGELLESSAFSDLVIGVKPQPESVVQPMKKLDGYKVVRPTVVATQLEQEGWTVRQPVPGYQRVSCIRRPLGTVDEGDSAAAPQVVQAIFSDGLTFVSVFIEPYAPSRHTRPMLTSIGATHTLMMRQGDWWMTIVGDVPPAALRAFAKGIERSR